MCRVEIDSSDNSIAGRLRSLIVTVFHLDWSSELALTLEILWEQLGVGNTSLTVIG